MTVISVIHPNLKRPRCILLSMFVHYGVVSESVVHPMLGKARIVAILGFNAGLHRLLRSHR